MGASAAAPDAGASAGVTIGHRICVVSGRADGLTGEVEEVSPVPYRLASEVRTDVATVAFPFDVRLRVPVLHLRTIR